MHKKWIYINTTGDVNELKKSKMTTMRATDAIQPGIAGAYKLFV